MTTNGTVPGEDLKTRFRRLLEAAKKPAMPAHDTQDAQAPTTGQHSVGVQDPGGSPDQIGSNPSPEPSAGSPEASGVDSGLPAVPESQEGEPALDPLLGSPQTVQTFPSNPHRFMFADGEQVSFFDESGNIQSGTVLGMPVGDQYQVQTGDGQQTVLKSELFYTPGQQAVMADPSQSPESASPASQ